MNHGFFIDIDMLVPLASTVGVLAGFGVWLRKLMRRLDNLLEDWNGAEARPGVPRRPGVMERLERIEGDVAVILRGPGNPSGGEDD